MSWHLIKSTDPDAKRTGPFETSDVIDLIHAHQLRPDWFAIHTEYTGGVPRRLVVIDQLHWAFVEATPCPLDA